MTSRGPREQKPKKSRDVRGPVLLSFRLNPDSVQVPGAFGSIPFAGSVTGEVGLDGPAPPGGVQVDIFLVRRPDGEITLGRITTTSVEEERLVRSVVVPEGETTASGGGVSYAGDWDGDFVYEARLGTVTLTAVLHTWG
jgi:hypothetical protein